MPPVPYGFNEHHKDFQGVIWIQHETLIAFVTDITKSLAYQGFRRILLLNSHGSDHPCLDLAARKTVIETGMIFVSASYWNLMSARINTVCKSAIGGIAHAGEFEAAMYMYLHPERLQIDKSTVQNLHNPDSKFFNLDLVGAVVARCSCAGGPRFRRMARWATRRCRSRDGQEVSGCSNRGNNRARPRNPRLADPSTSRRSLS
jgi:creatinine amidohydrolase/Fe(II)-dependent formamide hydrolase-like protein